MPLVARKATIVRAYLKFPIAVEVRGELMSSRSARAVDDGAFVGTAQLDPSRSSGTPAQLRSRRANLTFSLNFSLPPAFTTLGRCSCGWARSAG